MSSNNSGRGSRIKEINHETNEQLTIKESTNVNSVLEKEEKKSVQSKENIVNSSIFVKKEK